MSTPHSIKAVVAGTADPETLPFGCGPCGSRWSGLRTCHCATCHHTFTGVDGFDTHRKDGQCRSPERMRHPKTGDLLFQVAVGRAYQAWQLVPREQDPDGERRSGGSP